MLKFKSLKSKLAILLVMIMLFSLIGCGKQPGKEETPVGKEERNGESPENNDKEKEEEAIVVVDHLDREVKFEKPAERIVSGYYITSSMLISLGLKDKVIGIEGKPETRPIYGLAAPEFLELPTVGTMKEFDLEGTAELKPDLIIMSVRLKDSVESLEKLGFNVLAVNPESMEELEEALDMIGKATATEERANELKKYYKDKEDQLANLIEGRDKKRVYLGGNSDLLSTASGKMYQNTLISNAGGINVAEEIDDTYWADISYEQLIEYDPDVIIGAAGASYRAEDIKKDERLKSLKAIENDQVYIIPGSIEQWDSPIPSGIIGTMWLTSVLHEEVYPFDKFQEETYDFYKKFYDLEIKKEELEK